MEHIQRSWEPREMDGGAHRGGTATPRASGFVLIAAELGIRANNGSSGATCLPCVDFPSSPFPSPECLVLKRIIYQIIFIQLWRRKKKDGRGKKGPFAVLIALRRTCESGAGLIKAGAAESLPVANESCHVSSLAPPMDQIVLPTRQGLQHFAS